MTPRQHPIWKASIIGLENFYKKNIYHRKPNNVKHYRGVTSNYQDSLKCIEFVNPLENAVSNVQVWHLYNTHYVSPSLIRNHLIFKKRLFHVKDRANFNQGTVVSIQTHGRYTSRLYYPWVLRVFCSQRNECRKCSNKTWHESKVFILFCKLLASISSANLPLSSNTFHKWMCNPRNQPTPWPNTLEISFNYRCV